MSVSKSNFSKAKSGFKISKNFKVWPSDFKLAKFISISKNYMAYKFLFANRTSTKLVIIITAIRKLYAKLKIAKKSRRTSHLNC